jgi:purine-binding chemotaxis protein CheW
MTDTVAQELFETEDDTLRGKFLTFIIGNEQYGIEIKYVTEIVGIQDITEIPESPEFVRGIINLRGKIIPVIDMRLRFKKPFKEYDDRTCVIVVDFKEKHIGLIVDRVSEVITINEENVEPVNIENSMYGNGYIKGIGKVDSDVKLILDCEKSLQFEALSV